MDSILDSGHVIMEIVVQVISLDFLKYHIGS